MFTEALVRAIRERSRMVEERGALTCDILEIIYERRLFKLFVPEELGGVGASLPEALHVFEHCSWIDGSFGWSVGIGAGGGFFVNFMSPEVLKRVFAGRTSVIAGSGYPSGVARPVEGGYRVSGRWKYCSGALHATTFTASARVEPKDGDPEPSVLAFAFPPDQVEIIFDWRAFGLKGTGSHSIAVRDAFVPREMAFDLTRPLDTYDTPIYRYPFVPFSQATFTAIVVGIGRHFLDEAGEVAERKLAAGPGRDAGQARFALDRIEEARRRLTQARDRFYEAVDRSWNECVREKIVSAARRDEVSRECIETATATVESACSVFAYLGMEAVMEDSAVNRAFRDLMTARQHKLLLAVA